MLSEYDSGSDEGIQKSENLANVISEWSVAAGGEASVVAGVVAAHGVGAIPWREH